jgi:hypothetical protein
MCYSALPALALLVPNLTELDTISYNLIGDGVPYLLPLSTRRAMMEVFYTASIRDKMNVMLLVLGMCNLGVNPIKKSYSLLLRQCLLPWKNV